MVDSKIIPVILSGGSGSRLWPLSRALYPKQLLPLTGRQTMIQQTAGRIAEAARFAAPIVICNQEHRFVIAEQLRVIDCAAAAIILEPAARNTAPAIAVATLQALTLDDNPLLLVLPSDHLIADMAAFTDAVDKAKQLAEQGYLVTFGITPDRPETGYGYIRSGNAIAGVAGSYRIDRFVEKPNLQDAQSYLDSGDFYWNSGMFLFRADVLLAELKRLQPNILDGCQQALAQAQHDLHFLRLGATEFSALPSLSIDYAVMEQAARAAVVAADIGWNDVGAWSALWQLGEKDADGNVVDGDVHLLASRNCYVRGDGRLVAALGVDDLIIVDTADALLVATREQADQVKTVVEALQKEDRIEAKQHRRVYRPWGYYEDVDDGARFRVKRIHVDPGQRLSLQMHHHRAEHWVVVRGTAKVTRGDDSLMVYENESIFIPQGTSHRLENPGRMPLQLIEVQSGSYLGEDDIIRIDDQYGRAKRDKP